MITRDQMQTIIAGGKHLVQRKYDGELSEVRIQNSGARILTEFMRTPISGHFYTASDLEMFRRFQNGWYAALTIAEWQGENVLNETTAWRWDHLQSIAPLLPDNIILAETINHHPSSINDLFASGAEGICAHDWQGAWGNMLATKVNTIFVCIVTGFCGGTQSVEISRLMSKDQSLKSAELATLDIGLETLDKIPCGTLPLRGGKCDQVRVGSILRVEAMGITDDGKLRQAKPCREWLVQW